MSSLDNYEKLTIAWSNDRSITQNSTDISQILKLVSEVGELANSINKGKDVKDDLGSCLVSLTNIAAIRGITLLECQERAYNDAKGYKGHINKNEVFTKEENQPMTASEKIEIMLRDDYEYCAEACDLQGAIDNLAKCVKYMNAHGHSVFA